MSISSTASVPLGLPISDPNPPLRPFLSKSIVEHFLILTTFLMVGLTHQKSDTSVCTAVNLGMVVHYSHTCVILAVKLTMLSALGL